MDKETQEFLEENFDILGMALGTQLSNEFSELKTEIGALRTQVKQLSNELELVRAFTRESVDKQVSEYFAARQLSFLATLERVIVEDLSLIRFGDGEFRLMLEPDFRLGFQSNSWELAGQLSEAFEFACSDPRVMMALPHLSTHAHWRNVWERIWYNLKPRLLELDEFGDAHVSRPTFFQESGEEAVKTWRRVWESKRVSVVTGKGSRFKLQDALFDNCSSVDMIYSTPTEAFDDVDRLFAECVKNVEERDTELFLLSLGPAGTLLSVELVKAGYRALDIGHISNSYSVAFEGGVWPERNPLVVAEE
ncbi:GT-D fold domain-containing glycosyltransferase [Corynebacterium casei]|uniref:GT-D fold domain-containing glycosyltransferase n=1 Tax=Corynebacterium casei TaxID=160386 RepID=UPI003FD0B84B